MKLLNGIIKNNLDLIELQIFKTLDDVAIKGFNDNLKSEAEWTHRVKKSIGNLGLKLKFKVCASGFNDIFSNEWLYDLVWYEEKVLDGKNKLVNVPLIMESEWSRKVSDIKYDFEKLLISNAQRRLIICQTKTENIQNLYDYFKKAVKAYKLGAANDRYLIAILDDYNTGAFQYGLVIKEK